MMNSTRENLHQQASAGSKAPADLDASATSIDTPVATVSDVKAELGNRPVHFEELVERCMGNIDLATRLLDQSQEYLAKDLRLLKQFGGTGDPIEVTRLAHRLKGATATIGAYELSETFMQIEQCGRTGETATVSACLLELDNEWARFIECVTDLCGQK
ncbi:MAG: Hpt domain-containing protein [Pirellulaceae bacterium]|jgi:HPt (histidine-containing phosphotransfer) domain-containing protein|nr:Hpt domain-containing protein [Pirellulaceae bacterium]HJN12451.1 Hpt domain-containing protein [Pirellulaceae bacterium]